RVESVRSQKSPSARTFCNVVGKTTTTTPAQVKPLSLIGLLIAAKHSYRADLTAYQDFLHSNTK
ncbi:hypothetical protein SK128_022165, partial [Halocaridina rubra]